MNDQQVLDLARSHYRRQKEKHGTITKAADLESRWNFWAQSMAEPFDKFTDCKEVRRYAQSSIPFDHRLTVDRYPHGFWFYDSVLFGEFPQFVQQIRALQETSQSRAETLMTWDGRLLSDIIYWHMRPLLVCQAHLNKPKIVAEIGGGYGGMARLWMHNQIAVPERYIIIDLPESLFYSEVCLRAEFGDAVGYFDGQDPGTRILLVPIGELESLDVKPDLVLNIGSMQEMCDQWVSYYMDWLDRSGAQHFYSLNYMGQPLAEMMESRTFWAPRPSPKWTARIINSDVPLVKYQCSYRFFAEILFERADHESSIDEWSVLKGAYVTRDSYLNGLELLRRNPSQENATKFMDAFIKNNKSLPMPKEMRFVARMAGTSLPEQQIVIAR